MNTQIEAYQTYGTEYVRAYEAIAPNDPCLAESIATDNVINLQMILRAYGQKHDFGFAEEVLIYAKAIAEETK